MAAELVLKPAAVLEIEMYADDQINSWIEEDRLLSEERAAIIAGLA